MNEKSLADQLRAAADLIENNQKSMEQLGVRLATQESFFRLVKAFSILFGQHPSGSGTGGRSARGARRAARPWHKVIGVPAHATETQIKAAYRKLAKRHHPDRGGDAAKFNEIQKAYEEGREQAAVKGVRRDS